MSAGAVKAKNAIVKVESKLNDKTLESTAMTGAAMPKMIINLSSNAERTSDNEVGTCDLFSTEFDIFLYSDGLNHKTILSSVVQKVNYPAILNLDLLSLVVQIPKLVHGIANIGRIYPWAARYTYE